MTLKVALVLSGDAQGAIKAVDDAEVAIAGAEKEAQALAAAFKNADTAIGALAKVQDQANRELVEAKAALTAGAISQEAYTRQVLETKTALGLMQAEHRKAASELAKADRAYVDAVSGIGKHARATEQAGKSTKLAGHHVQNLAFQVNDLAVQLASGANPMTAFAQQGSQIAGVMMQAGVGVGGFAKQLLLLAAPFAPIIAAVGLVAAGIGLLTSEINKNGEVQVTWQDTVLGAWDAAKAYLTGVLTPAFDYFGVTAAEAWSTVVSAAKWAINWLIGAATLAPRALIAAWNTFPGAVAEVFVGAFNAAIGAMNAFIKGAVAGLNGYIANANAILGLFGKSIPTIVAPQIGKLNNIFAGNGAKFGSAMLGAMKDTFSRDFIGEGASFLKPFAQARARGRAAEDGKAAGSAAGKAAGQAAGKAAAEEFPKELQKGLEDAKVWLGSLEKDADAWAKSLASKSALTDIGDLFDELRKKQTGYIDALVQAAEIAANRAQALMGAIGGTIGRIGGALTSGDPRQALLGMGGVGTLAGLALSPSTFNKLASDITSGIREAFGQNTPFAETMGNLLAGAGIGGMVGGIAFGGNKSAQFGASAGGAIGAELGKEFLKGGLESIAKGLGAAAGPIGAIAGSLIGGLLGGLMKKVKKASATVGVVGGELDVTSVVGNSSSRKAASSQAANSVIDALMKIADQFNADLGSAAVSIGIRNKKYVVDTTGQGRTKGAGTINFGQDSEAALKAAIQDAISDGVFKGLSAGVEKLLKNPGDIEKQLQKALDLQGVFNSVNQRADPSGFALGELDKWKARMVAIATEAGEGMVQVEQEYAVRRADIIKQAARDALEAERPRRELEIQIMQLQGKSVEALAATRQLEKQAADETLIPLLGLKYILEDAAAAAAEAEQKMQTLQALNLRYYQALGDDAKVKALQRSYELAAATDEHTRSMLRAIYANEDLKASLDATAKAAQDAADTAKRIAEEGDSIQAQIDQLLGNTAALRDRERAALNEANRARYDYLQGLKDEMATAAEAAAKAKAVADERAGLMEQIWQLTGNTAALQKAALDKLDPSNRAYQQYIWSLQAAKEEAEAAAQAEQQRGQAIADAKNALVQAFKSEAQAQQQYIDKFRGFSSSIREFLGSLNASSASDMGLAAARGRFGATSRMAGFGNEASLAAFNGDAQAYIEAARNYGTAEDLRRAILDVSRGGSRAIGAADGLATAAQAQLNAQRAAVEKLVDLEEKTVSVSEALDRLNELQKSAAIPATERISASIETLASAVTANNQAQASTSADAKTLFEKLALDQEDMLALLRQVIREGAVLVAADDPLPVDTTP